MDMKGSSCLLTATAFKERLENRDTWSKVVIYSWYDEKNKKLEGHAITAYMFPAGKNQLWTYDCKGNFKVRAFKEDPIDIAQKAVIARNESRYITSAAFLK